MNSKQDINIKDVVELLKQIAEIAKSLGYVNTHGTNHHPEHYREDVRCQCGPYRDRPYRKTREEIEDEIIRQAEMNLWP